MNSHTWNRKHICAVREETVSLFLWRDLERHCSLCLDLLAETEMYLDQTNVSKLLGPLTLTHEVSQAALRYSFLEPLLCTQHYAQSRELHGEQK